MAVVRDIIVSILKADIPNLVNHYSHMDDMPENWGWKYRLCYKQPKRIEKNSRIFFVCEYKIIAYGIILKTDFNEELNNYFFRGELWAHRDKTIIMWRYTRWYKKPIEYKKKIGVYKTKYINMERLLKGQAEPEVSKERWI